VGEDVAGALDMMDIVWRYVHDVVAVVADDGMVVEDGVDVADRDSTEAPDVVGVVGAVGVLADIAVFVNKVLLRACRNVSIGSFISPFLLSSSLQ